MVSSNLLGAMMEKTNKRSRISICISLAQMQGCIWLFNVHLVVYIFSVLFLFETNVFEVHGV